MRPVLPDLYSSSPEKNRSRADDFSGVCALAAAESSRTQRATDAGLNIGFSFALPVVTNPGLGHERKKILRFLALKHRAVSSPVFGHIDIFVDGSGRELPDWQSPG